MKASMEALLDQFAELLAPKLAQRLATDLRAPTSEPTSSVADFYTEQDLAARSRLSPRTLQGWRFRDRGPPWVRVGRRVLYPRAAADDFLRKGQAAS
jgi:hypothetical protein